MVYTLFFNGRGRKGAKDILLYLHIQTPVSYLQEEAVFINCSAQRKAAFPGSRVRLCWAGDVLPGGLLLVHYKT